VKIPGTRLKRESSQMRHFRSLLINKADIRLPGLRVLTLPCTGIFRACLDRAAPAPLVSDLLYLSGRGQQEFASGEARVEPGTLVVMPPGCLMPSGARPSGRPCAS